MRRGSTFELPTALAVNPASSASLMKFARTLCVSSLLIEANFLDSAIVLNHAFGKALMPLAAASPIALATDA